MKKFFLIFLCFLLMTGCKTKNNDENKNSSEKQLISLKKEMENLKQKIEKDDNKELTNLKEEIDSLKQTIDENNKKIEALTNDKKVLEEKVNQLQNVSISNDQNIISKNQLIGTWKSRKQSLVFTDSNCDVIGNWIIYYGQEEDASIFYMYKGGKLYITDGGAVLTK